ncbi:MAG: lytic transglycosylase domain-containing protein [Deltaproteobacteria bacterium]|nr:lytic transglycosylase domain-containing protein [Deltaproteobacteria bacterium]
MRPLFNHSLLLRRNIAFISRFILFCSALVWLISIPVQASCAAIELPLALRLSLLQRSLTQYMNPTGDPVTVLYQEGPYNYLHTDRIQLYVKNGQLHFTCHGVASLGVKFLDMMPVGARWSGSMDMTLNPYVDSNWQLRYRVVDSSIYDEEGKKPVITGFVWDLTKKFLHPRLENFSLDLSMPQQEITAILQACASAEEVEQFEAMLRTMTVGVLRTDDAGIVVPLVMTVADSRMAEVVPPEELPLLPEEIESFQKVLEPWDAFLVFVIKSAGADFVDEQMRKELFDLLINSRYQLLPILSGEAPVDSGDPLRSLFVEAWQQLRLILEHAEQRGLTQEQPVRYMTFVNAGDALLALDAAAPSLGMQITSDGLRRLARTLQPEAAGDPLRFDWEVDPVLRELFKFAPEPEELPEPEPEPEPESEPESEPEVPLSKRLFDMLFPVAYAAEPDLFKRLNRWVPGDEELQEYQALVEQLLKSIADEELQGANLDPRYAPVFQNMVPATAMIESCWQQFVRKDGQVSFLKSQAGSIGLMQINQNVWRGFYNLERLRWETGYNTRAGVQILMRYLKENGIAVAAKSNDPSLAARATYSVYNAGPRAAKRFMKPGSSAREKRVDGRFWSLYQGFAAGGSVDLSTCNVNVSGS